MSNREYGLYAVASVAGSTAALFWALAEHLWVALGCVVLSVLCMWRVFRYDVGKR